VTRPHPDPGRPGVGGGVDLLRWPLVGRVLGWRHTRTVLQSVFLGVAILLILDGWFGPQLAPRNLAGVLPWVHWRGFLILALLVAGNLFCMACPFLLPRRLAKRFLPASRTWPAKLQSKWLSLGLLLSFFWAYEAFSLWASPWLTAWVAATYFVGAFVVDGFFRGAAFCRFVCPIGQFNFVHATLSPLEVRVREPERCGDCKTQDCIRGRYSSEALDLVQRARGRDADGGVRPRVADDRASGRALGRAGLVQGGCELALFQPRKVGNLDCTFCLECIHACPHQNVGVFARVPGKEWTASGARSGVGKVWGRLDLMGLTLFLVFAAFLNALGMIQPFSRLEAWLASGIGMDSRPLVLLFVFALGWVLLPLATVSATAGASLLLSGRRDGVGAELGRRGWMLLPLGFAMWAAHYLFHFGIGAGTLLPVVQQYLRDFGIPAGSPRWGVGTLVPEGWLFPLQLAILQAGFLGSLLLGWEGALRVEGRDRRRAVRAFLPWALLASALALSGAWILGQPMEMRGGPNALLSDSPPADRPPIWDAIHFAAVDSPSS
jgi:polyferredoxin